MSFLAGARFSLLASRFVDLFIVGLVLVVWANIAPLCKKSLPRSQGIRKTLSYSGV